MMRPTWLAFSLSIATALHALPAQAQDDMQDQQPRAESVLVIYGEDACPAPSAPDEIVVCARRPEEERYRIPPPFRDRGDRPMEVSWAARAEQLEEAQRDSRPNSCSPVGSWGQSGCTQALIRQWQAERRQQRAREEAWP